MIHPRVRKRNCFERAQMAAHQTGYTTNESDQQSSKAKHKASKGGMELSYALDEVQPVFNDRNLLRKKEELRKNTKKEWTKIS